MFHCLSRHVPDVTNALALLSPHVSATGVACGVAVFSSCLADSRCYRVNGLS